MSFALQPTGAANSQAFTMLLNRSDYKNLKLLDFSFFDAVCNTVR